MKKEDVKKAIEELNAEDKQRKFSQTYDLILTYKNLDLKKTENQIDFYTTLHNPIGKEVKICAFVDTELHEQAKNECTTAIHVDDFGKYSDKKDLKRLADNHDFFVAQATIMPKVATAFGKVLGPRGKMPNPKAGCVVPPNANLKPLVQKLQKTVRILAKTAPMTQMVVGKEGMEEEQIIDNILTIYDQAIHHLPAGRDQIKNIYLKKTMGKPVKVDF